jgi:pimeloyl-ACP methyl ester carboxylesterase
MADIVLVPGSHHGGWYFSPIVPALRAAGDRVFPMTPTGVGDKRHLTNGAINLDTHIQDLVNIVEMENINDVVLVGHSYGGMVVTGSSSRPPGRVRALVYLDGHLPQDGQRAWDLIIKPVRRRFLNTTEDGLTHRPPPELGDRVSPHPLSTYLQPVHLAPSTFDARRKVYVWAQGNPEGGTFEAIYQRLLGVPGWQTHKVPSGHDLVVEAPELVVDLIRSAAEDEFESS